MGVWIASDRTEQRETGCVYEVSFPPDGDYKRSGTGAARHLFLTAAHAMGEEWVHMERHKFASMHAQLAR